jgi:hypothetical protein
LWAFNKFCMGFWSLVMNSTYLSLNEEMVPIFGSDINSINVDNLPQENGELHLIKVIHVPNDDSYALDFHTTNLRN